MNAPLDEKKYDVYQITKTQFNNRGHKDKNLVLFAKHLCSRYKFHISAAKSPWEAALPQPPSVVI